MSIKKMYLVLGLFIIAFLSFQCGGNDNKNDSAQMEDQADNSQASVHKGNSVQGKQYFMQTCAACHGQDAKGLPKLGKDLITSQFVAEKTDEGLLAYVKEGRLPSDPLNTTGVAMPPKGGNPSLTDEQIMDIIAYMREIHQK